jgi:hypothetical protein
MLLSTGFVFALWMSCRQCKLGAGWGLRGESMLPFLRRPWKPKRARSHRNTVSSQRVNIGYLLSGCFIEGHVGLLGGPESMEQDGQLPGYRNDGLALGLLTASGWKTASPLQE